VDLTRDDVRRQLELEAESRSLGEARYNRSRPLPWRTTTSAATDEEANLPPGQHLLRLAVEPTAEALRTFVAKANDGAAGRRHSAVKWLELASPEEVAYLTARATLNHAARRSWLQTAAIDVANRIIDHVDMVTFSGKNKPGYHGLVKKSRFAKSSSRRMAAIRKMLETEDSRTAIGHAEKLHLGMAALELLIEAPGLFTVDTMKRAHGRGYYIRPTEAVEQWLSGQHDRSALLEPLLMPMVVRPRRWRNLNTGGYLRRQSGIRGSLVKTYDRAHRALLEEADLSLVYEAVNHIQ
jgi:DNA-directed RNA polymerase